FRSVSPPLATGMTSRGRGCRSLGGARTRRRYSVPTRNMAGTRHGLRATTAGTQRPQPGGRARHPADDEGMAGMDMEVTAWVSLHHAMHQGDERRRFSRATLRRIARFARPHRLDLVVFLVLSVVVAVLAVATPVLAGRVVDAIDDQRDSGEVVRLAFVIAAIAVAEAVVSFVTRWLSARIGEGLILDLRRAVFDHVQRMPVAFFTRTRTGALVSRLDNDVIGAQRAFSDTLSG